MACSKCSGKVILLLTRWSSGETQDFAWVYRKYITLCYISQLPIFKNQSYSLFFFFLITLSSEKILILKELTAFFFSSSFECLCPLWGCRSLLGSVLSYSQPWVSRISLMRKQVFLKYEEKNQRFKEWLNKGENQVWTSCASNLSTTLLKDRHWANGQHGGGLHGTRSRHSSTTASPDLGKLLQPLLEVLFLALKWVHQICFAALFLGSYMN